MQRLPVYFISHGAPDLLTRDVPASKFMKELSLPLDKARAILVISAHWETEEPEITAVTKPETIHDFYGFPKELYDIRYPVIGSAELAEEIADILKTNGFKSILDYTRGLDHGAWMPLYLIAPKCALPVLQLSIQTGKSPEYHYNVGKAIAPLRNKGVIIIGSGNITHNLRAALRDQTNESLKYAEEFEAWLHEALLQKEHSVILDWVNNAPHAKWNHPTDDHILPLFTVLGTSDNDPAERIHQSYDYNVLSMGSYIFGKK